MDKATPANKGFLRDVFQCSENTNLDCNQYLSSGGDYQKKTKFARQSAHNFTDFGGQYFREKTYLSNC